MRETASISSARAGLRPRLGLVIAAAVLSAAAGPAERDRAELKNGAIGNGPPVPLQDARCVLPPALKGVTGHALLSYVVDPSGDVTSIRTVYAAASPESRREAFAAALENCLKPWRYRPRGFHGIAVEESLLIAFHYLEDPAPDAPFIAVGGGRTMPLAHFEEIRREKLKLAASLLAGPGYAEFSGDGWVLRTGMCRGTKSTPSWTRCDSPRGRSRPSFPDHRRRPRSRRPRSSSSRTRTSSRKSRPSTT